MTSSQVGFSLWECSFAIGSYDSIDTPRRLPRQRSQAFGSSDQLPVSFAVVFEAASFSWSPKQPGMGRVLEQEASRAEWRGPGFACPDDLVIRGIDLALVQGTLTVIVGEVGAGGALPPDPLAQLSYIDVASTVEWATPTTAGRRNVATSRQYLPLKLAGRVSQCAVKPLT